MSDQMLACLYVFGPAMMIAGAACLADFVRSFRDQPARIIRQKAAR